MIFYFKEKIVINLKIMSSVRVKFICIKNLTQKIKVRIYYEKLLKKSFSCYNVLTFKKVFMTNANYEFFLEKESLGEFKNTPIFPFYKNLSKKDQKKYLIKIINDKNPSWTDYIVGYHLPSLTSFLKEFFEHSLIENFKTSFMFDEFLHALFYAKNPDNEKEFEIKKEAVELLIKHFDLDINKTVNQVPPLHIAATQSSVSFLEWLIQIGANAEKIDSDNDSFASSTLCTFENIEALSYAISLPTFNPLCGNNILSYAIEENYQKAIDLIVSSSCMENSTFISKVRNDYPDEMENIIMPSYEKKRFEKSLTLTSIKKTIKL